MDKNDIVLGLAYVSLYLSNIGKKEYSETVEESCHEITELRAEIDRLKAEKTKAIENIDLNIADAKSDAKMPSRTGKGYSVGLYHGLLIAKEILQGIRNHG